MDKKDLIAVRELLESDKNFILATFLRGLYYGDTWFKLIPKSIFMKNYHPVITHILESPNTKVKVAYLIDEKTDDKETIVSYALMNKDETVLHWVFSKSAWRSIGITKLLIPSTIKSVTHLTKIGMGLLKKHPEVIFNPFDIGIK